MTAIVDLSFEQVVAEYDSDSEAFFVGEDTSGNIGVLISLTALMGEPVENLTSGGVVKMCNRLLNLCRKAQATVNQNQVDGEKLNAFLNSVSSGTIQDGYVEITDSMKSRIVVSSATRIEGSTI